MSAANNNFAARRHCKAFLHRNYCGEKKSDFKAKSPFGDDLEQMRSTYFQKLGCPPAFQLLVIGSEEITLILNCKHLFYQKLLSEQGHSLFFLNFCLSSGWSFNVSVFKRSEVTGLLIILFGNECFS